MGVGGWGRVEKLGTSDFAAFLCIFGREKNTGNRHYVDFVFMGVGFAEFIEEFDGVGNGWSG